jgi:hypothetical protein
MTTQQILHETMKGLNEELLRLRRNNLRLRLHMEVLASNPDSQTAQKIREKFGISKIIHSTINKN